jgi:hypothetical protein
MGGRPFFIRHYLFTVWILICTFDCILKRLLYVQTVLQHAVEALGI